MKNCNKKMGFCLSIAVALFFNYSSLQAQNPLVLPVIIDNVVLTHPSNCGVDDGSILIEITNDQSDAIFSIDDGVTWYDDSLFVDLPIGDYQVSVAYPDTNGVVDHTSVSSLINENAPLLIGVSTFLPDACAGVLGSIEITASGTDPLIFSIDNGSTWSSNNLFSDLPEMMYDVLVANAADTGCIQSWPGNPIDFPLVVAPSITNVTPADPTSCGAANGSIAIIATPGSQIPEFSINNGISWSLANPIQNLSAGTYNVMVRNIDGSCPIAYASNPVVLSDPNAPTFDSVIPTDPFSCTDMSGSITINASGGLGPLQYSLDGSSWFGSNVFSGLGAGNHSPAVRNFDGTCMQDYGPVTLTPQVDNCPDITIINIPAGSTSNVCLDAFVGFLDPIVSAGECTIGTSSITVATDNSTACVDLTPDLGFFGADTVCVYHCNGGIPLICDTTELIVRVIPPIDTLYLDMDAGTSQNICLDNSVLQYTAGTITAFAFCDSGNAASVEGSNMVENCLDLTADAGFSGTAPMICAVQCYDFTGTICDTTYISVDVYSSGCLPEFGGITIQQTMNCTGDNYWCTGWPIDTLTDLNIYKKGNLITSGTQECDSAAGELAILLDPNSTTFVFENTALGCSDTVTIELTNPVPTYSGATSFDIECDEEQVVCLPMLSSQQFFYGIEDNGATIFPTSCGANMAVSLDTGAHNLLVTHLLSGCSDWIVIDVNCVPGPVCDAEFLGEDVMQELDDCDSQYEFCTDISELDIALYDFYVNGAIYTGPFTTCKGSTVGISFDTGDYEIVASRNDFVCSDTVSVSIDCLLPTCGSFMWADEDTYYADDCDDEVEICFPINLDDNPQLTLYVNGEEYREIVHTCSSGTSAIYLPQGDHDVRFVNTSANCEDRQIVHVRCNPPNAELVLNLEVNAVDTVCIEGVDLTGPIVSAVNDCPDSSGEYATVALLTDNCIEVIGVEAGEEDACITFCDDYGNCHTIDVNIQVSSDDTLPVANDDEAVAMEDEQLTVAVLDNDELNGDLDSVYILSAQGAAQVWMDNDGTLYALIDADSCQMDSLVTVDYVVCNTVGCDTATVLITTICDVPETVSGFSPNGDGINEAFVITGLEDYPDHELFIFNRYGAQILNVKDYQNDWIGTWDGNHLPDGTYYWLLDTGDGFNMSGWVQIKR